MLIEHGTFKGYRMEKSLGLPVCEPCRKAKNWANYQSYIKNPQYREVTKLRKYALELADHAMKYDLYREEYVSLIIGTMMTYKSRYLPINYRWKARGQNFKLDNGLFVPIKRMWESDPYLKP